MTQLAYTAAVLGIPVELGRLYDGDDPYFVGWVATVVDMALDYHRKQS